MKITATEYERGLLRWAPIEGIQVFVGTASGEEAGIKWSGPYTESNGAVLGMEISAKVVFRFEGGPRLDPNQFWIKVERTDHGVVNTRVWRGVPNSKPTILRHLPDYGTYHRLVVDAGTLGWDQDLVVREGNVLIRFVTGTVEGELSDELKAVNNPDGTVSLQGAQQTATATGRFIEVVAPGESPDEAELHVHALLGLLALALGQNVLGKTVFSEPWTATPDQQAGAAIALGSEFPRQAAAGEFGGLDGLVGQALGTGRIERARMIGLRWYERGFRAAEPLDMLLSFYIGIEALVAACARDNAPLPVEQQRQAQNDAIVQAVTPLGQAVRDRVSARMRGASTREQFEFYAQTHNLGADDGTNFRNTKDIRDDAVHGDPVAVDMETARKAEQLLRRMLKAELGITGELPWETHPVIYAARLEFSLVDAKNPPTRTP
jgi:hypothetical protein